MIDTRAMETIDMRAKEYTINEAKAVNPKKITNKTDAQMNNTQKQNADSIVIPADWDIRAKGLQEQFPLLSDHDLHYEEGKENELLCRIETRLNKSRDEVISILQMNVIIVELPNQHI